MLVFGCCFSVRCWRLTCRRARISSIYFPIPLPMAKKSALPPVPVFAAAHFSMLQRHHSDCQRSSSLLPLHLPASNTCIKYLGAAYLLYLGYQFLHHSGSEIPLTQAKRQTKSSWQIYQQGVLVDILNPKVALFFMAFLPQFIRDEAQHGSLALQFLYLGLIIVLMAFLVELVYVLLALKLRDHLDNKRGTSVIIERITGSLFLMLGVKMVLETNH